MNRTQKINLFFSSVIFIWSACVIYASYFVPPLADPNKGNISNLQQIIFRFGFNQLHLTPIWITLLLFLMFALFFFLKTEHKQRLDRMISRLNEFIFKNWQSQLLVSLCAGIFFWIFRSNFLNTDYLLFGKWYFEYIEKGAVMVRFDEMWETYLHFEFYKLMNSAFGWSIKTSFQFISCLCGVPLTFILLKLCRAMSPRKPLLPFLMFLSGGYIQLFFGDLECYTICAMLAFCYLYFAYQYIHQKVPLILPAFFLMAAMTAHMAVVFLVPSLVYLSIIEFQKREYLNILTSILVFFGLLSISLLFFMSKGILLSRMVETSWGLGRGGSVFGNITEYSTSYFWGQINLIGLIFPPAFMLLPYLLTTPFRKNHWNIFLLVASIFGIGFFFTWTSTIGQYMDWNLFSLPLIAPITGLIYNISLSSKFKIEKVFIFSLSFLMTYSWILWNHFQ